MTTEEIIRVLAERDGWNDIKIGSLNWFGRNSEYCAPDYLNSKDAIGRVLEKLTEEEWNRFISLPCLGKESFRGTWAQFYLTLPTEVLALCVAEAIKNQEAHWLRRCASETVSDHIQRSATCVFGGE